jgi:hypothetical protein
MDKKIKWYNSANTITSLIIGVISLIIIFSQSFALGRNGSIELFTSIINHNSVYLFILIYFVLLKFYIGKKYFNYLSVFIIFIYFITTITSLLTLVQAFSLNTVLDFILNILLLVYLTHTLLRDTRVWREFYLSKSPFNEIPNDVVFYIIAVVDLILLSVNLVNTVAISGVVISILDTIYIVLMARYIYLYRDYLDKKKIDVGENMSLDDLKKTIKEIDKSVSKTVDDIGKKVNDYVVEKEIDKKIDIAKDKVVETSKTIGKEISKAVEDTKKEMKKSTGKKKTTKKEAK